MKAQDVKKSGKNVSMIERVQKGSKKEKQMLDSLLKEWVRAHTPNLIKFNTFFC